MGKGRDLRRSIQKYSVLTGKLSRDSQWLSDLLFHSRSKREVPFSTQDPKSRVLFKAGTTFLPTPPSQFCFKMMVAPTTWRTGTVFHYKTQFHQNYYQLLSILNYIVKPLTCWHENVWHDQNKMYQYFFESCFSEVLFHGRFNCFVLIEGRHIFKYFSFNVNLLAWPTVAKASLVYISRTQEVTG